MQLSDLVPNANGIGFLAGEALAANDLVVLERYTLKGWKAINSNFAAVGTMTAGTAQTNAASGQIVAQTSVIAAQTPAYARQAVIKDTDDNIITLTTRASGQGAQLSKFTPSGDLIFTLAIDTTPSPSYNHHLLLLGNGSVAAMWVIGSTLKYHVTNTVSGGGKNTTTIDTLQAPYFSAITLSGGGFAILYQPSSAPLTTKLSTYDNNGNAVLAATTIWTRTGTSGDQYHRMLELSNGNILAGIVSNNTVSNFGLYVGVFTTGGANVVAFTNINATAVAQYAEINTLTGYFAVEYLDGTNHSIYVFSNAGAQQGSTIAYATTITGSNRCKLLNDGTDFVAFFTVSTVGVCQKVTTGGVKRTEQGTDLTTSIQNFYLDGFYERGLLFFAGMSGAAAAAPVFWVIDANTLKTLGLVVTTFGSAPATTNGSYIRVIPGGDFAFIALYDYANVAATNLCVGKYTNAAVIGPSQVAVAAGAQGWAYAERGSYPINKINGLPGKVFDHSANLVGGSKGVLMTYGIKIKD